MHLVEMTHEERAALDAAQRPARRVREWRRLQAVRLLADGHEAPAVAQLLGCSASAVYYWAEAWREEGLAGLAEGAHAGRPRRLDLQAETALAQLLVDDPQAHGYAATDWTAPLLRTELAQRGHALSERTLRRTLHRLGFRWKRPKYVLGRPDPAYEAKKGH
jgi:transposase